MQIPRRNFLGTLAAAATAPSAKNRRVVVVGGGPAGVCAAIAAARNGAETLIVEQGNCLGGMATQGLVGPFMTCYDKTGTTQIIRGLFEEIVRRMVDAGGAIHPSKVEQGTAFTAWIARGHAHCTPFETESLKLVLDELCAEAGVRVLYHAVFLAPVLDGCRITGVDVFTKAGTRRISAAVVIDATGDGDVAFRAGVPFEKGDSSRGGAMQPCTTFFRIGNLPEEVVEKARSAHPQERLFATYVKQARAAGEWNIPRPHINLYRSVKHDEWFVNSSRMPGIDATDPDAVSKAEAEGRRQVRQILSFLRKYVPGAQDVRLLCTASTLGVRETRHFRGEYWLGLEDIMQGKTPEDSIALCANSVDLHGGKGVSGTLYRTIENGNWYGVPYRCLLPQKIDGLLLAGRCISADSLASAAVRVMPPCMAFGQAAGTAAALAVASNVAPRSVDVPALLSTLKQQKAFLG